jgi:RimJ/RimL family protein N-acetyltransferase
LLEGEHIRLRPVGAGDGPRLRQWREAAQGNAGVAQAGFGRRSDRRVLAIDTRGGEFIGQIALEHIAWRQRTAELWVHIGEESQRSRGYGTDAVRTAVRYAFEVLGLERVYLRVHADNRPAVRCYLKCGFVKEGLLRGGGRVERPLLLMSLRRPEGLQRLRAPSAVGNSLKLGP